MTKEAVDHLVTKRDGVYIDGTLGAGGHSEAVRRALQEGGKIIGIDRDTDALHKTKERLAGSGILFLHGCFDDLGAACRLLGTDKVDGILLDLGISSLQVDHSERGFSFAKEARLDMRMDQTEETTAEKIIAESTRPELEKIFREYGEERFASRIAGAILAARDEKRIKTTTELAGIISRAIPRKAWPHRIHPATRSFQGLRIAVNRELQHLERLLKKAPSFLAPGGRLVVLSYHSLEDRLVKQAIVQWDREGIMKRMTKKPIYPTEAEIEENPRARSAKMRVAERTERA
jgi:16S rRNA (cytosine1402-N4)-methyltransferase